MLDTASSQRQIDPPSRSGTPESKSIYRGARSGHNDFQMVRFSRGLGSEGCYKKIEAYERERGVHKPILNRSIDVDLFTRKLMMTQHYHEFIDWFYDPKFDYLNP